MKFAINRYSIGLPVILDDPPPVAEAVLEEHAFGAPPRELRPIWIVEIDSLDQCLELIDRYDLHIAISRSEYRSGGALEAPGERLYGIALRDNPFSQSDTDLGPVRILRDGSASDRAGRLTRHPGWPGNARTKFALNRYDVDFHAVVDDPPPIADAVLEWHPFGIPPYELRQIWVFEIGTLEEIVARVDALDLEMCLSRSGYWSGSSLEDLGERLYGIATVGDWSFPIDPRDRPIRIVSRE